MTSQYGLEFPTDVPKGFYLSMDGTLLEAAVPSPSIPCPSPPEDDLNTTGGTDPAVRSCIAELEEIESYDITDPANHSVHSSDLVPSTSTELVPSTSAVVERSSCAAACEGSVCEEPTAEDRVVEEETMKVVLVATKYGQEPALLVSSRMRLQQLKAAKREMSSSMSAAREKLSEYECHCTCCIVTSLTGETFLAASQYHHNSIYFLARHFSPAHTSTILDT